MVSFDLEVEHLSETVQGVVVTLGQASQWNAWWYSLVILTWGLGLFIESKVTPPVRDKEKYFLQWAYTWTINIGLFGVISMVIVNKMYLAFWL